MLKVMLVDDEQEGLDVLEYDLNRLNLHLEVVGKYDDPKEALAALRSTPPDLLFLDIEMPWMNGFELLDQLDRVDFAVIFVTAYDQYAIKAFRYLAVDYLLKPVEIDLLRDALERVIAERRRISSEHLQALIEQMRSRNTQIRKIAIPTSDGYACLFISDIVRCEADNNYAHVYLQDGRQFLVSKPLKYLEDLLTGHQFYRSHQSHLINLNHVQRYVKSDGGFIEMTDGAVASISRSKKEEFVRILRGI